MSLGFVRKASGLIGAFGAGALVFGGAGDALGQQRNIAGNLPGPSASRVSPGDCGAFASYLVDEAKAEPSLRGGTFLKTALRFVKAGCTTHDAQGEIEIITETKEDAISFGTSLRRMGKVDILGHSGVKHCHRPPNGVCPAKTGSVAPGSAIPGGG